MRSSAVKDELTIAGNLRTLERLFVVFQSMRIDTNRAGNSLTVRHMTPTTSQINNEDLVACVELLFEFFRRDPCKPKLAHNSKPADQLGGGVDREPSKRENCHKRSHSGSSRVCWALYLRRPQA